MIEAFSNDIRRFNALRGEAVLDAASGLALWLGPILPDYAEKRE